MMEWAGLWGLFLSGFISSTLLPGGSEVLLGALVLEQLHPHWQLFAAATIGNTLGGAVTFIMGWVVSMRWPLNQPDGRYQKRALAWIRRYGVSALLFSWLPVIGDPLCFVAGWLRLNRWMALLLIFSGKAIRYLLIVLAIS